VAAASVGLWLGVWGVIAVYGAVDELTQPWAGRFCDLNDWLADIGGGAIGLALAWVVWWSVRSRWRTESEV
jgi:VanZ family protein